LVPRPLIGTRGSPLALWQANHVRALLIDAHGLGEDAVALEPITTSGDRIRDKPLRDFGGKGLFTKEIDDALLNGAVDLAVHSMKDLPTELPPGIVIAAVLKRGDVRDAFISASGESLAALPPGAVVGSSSLRRQAQVKRLRPDLRVIDFRGNVESRLAKLERGVADATLLALAGLRRLGLASYVTSILSTEEMLPAVAQGAIAAVARVDDETAMQRLSAIDHLPSRTCVVAERAFLAVLDGSCRTPIAGLATLSGSVLTLQGQVLSPDGRKVLDCTEAGPAADAVALGERAGHDLLRRGAARLFDGSA
jgi:hydroxymethylbilane synthase